MDFPKKRFFGFKATLLLENIVDKPYPGQFWSDFDKFDTVMIRDASSLIWAPMNIILKITLGTWLTSIQLKIKHTQNEIAIERYRTKDIQMLGHLDTEPNNEMQN